MASCDLVVVGGGVGGASLAKGMAEHGARVLVLEREQQFRDRVRGEFIFPWGVAEAKALGVYDTLLGAGGHHPARWADFVGPDPLPERDLARTTPQKVQGLSIYHPLMQQALLEAAAAAGAEVRRGVRVRQVLAGSVPTIHLEGDGGPASVTARMVVGADGRGSMVRKWAGFTARDDPPGNVVSGVLLHDVPATHERTLCVNNPFASRMVLYFPQTRSSGRAYLVTRAESPVRLQGNAQFGRFLLECTRSGLAADAFEGARQAGPLATFDGADSWVEHPYDGGVALIGDAAAASDPTWGQGLSLTLRDARELRDALLATDDWSAAGHTYAAAHDRYHHAVRTTNSWFTQLLLTPGAEADAMRERVLPQLATDPLLLPDTIFSGPDFAPPTEEHRAKLFG